MTEASDNFKKMLIEAFGAYCLMYLRLNTSMGSTGMVGINKLVEYALQIALLIWFGQGLSGAYYYSSITIMSIVDKTLQLKIGLLYILAQFGGCFGAALQVYLRNKWKKLPGYGNYPHWFGRREWFFGFIMEFVSTMLFAMFVLAFKKQKRCPEAMIGPLIGLSYVAFSTAIRMFTGGALDSWFFLAPALLYMKFSVSCVIYLVGPPLGAICGYFLFEFCFSQGKGNSGLREPMTA